MTTAEEEMKLRASSWGQLECSAEIQALEMWQVAAASNNFVVFFSLLKEIRMDMKIKSNKISNMIKIKGSLRKIA